MFATSEKNYLLMETVWNVIVTVTLEKKFLFETNVRYHFHAKVLWTIVFSLCEMPCICDVCQKSLPQAKIVAGSIPKPYQIKNCQMLFSVKSSLKKSSKSLWRETTCLWWLSKIIFREKILYEPTREAIYMYAVHVKSHLHPKKSLKYYYHGDNWKNDLHQISVRNHFHAKVH